MIPVKDVTMINRDGAMETTVIKAISCIIRAVVPRPGPCRA